MDQVDGLQRPNKYLEFDDPAIVVPRNHIDAVDLDAIDLDLEFQSRVPRAGEFPDVSKRFIAENMTGGAEVLQRNDLADLRRIKAWAGQPLRSLRRLSRVEQSVVEARVAGEIGPVPWAQVAASGGFADQAHLCREVREVTGHSPAELARKTHTDESYWVYRIWS